MLYWLHVCICLRLYNNNNNSNTFGLECRAFVCKKKYHLQKSAPPRPPPMLCVGLVTYKLQCPSSLELTSNFADAQIKGSMNFNCTNMDRPVRFKGTRQHLLFETTFVICSSDHKQ